jgi:hypothetical protein
MYGNGTYTAYGNKALMTARHYAGDGEAIRAAIRKDAKIIKYTEVQKQLKAEQELIYAERNSLKALSRDDPAFQAARTRLRELDVQQALIGDEGRYATMKGYDAIQVDHAEGAWADGYMVVLNRTAMVIQRTNV